MLQSASYNGLDHVIRHDKEHLFKRRGFQDRNRLPVYPAQCSHIQGRLPMVQCYVGSNATAPVLQNGDREEPHFNSPLNLKNKS